MRSGSIYTYIRVAISLAIPLIVMTFGAASAVVRAEPGDRPPWALVTVLPRGGDPAARGAAVRSRLESAGIALAPSAEISTRLEERDSTDATPIAASDIERWASRSRAALRFLSHGDYAEARRALLEAQAISERAAEALNRETLRARQVLDTCLFVVRAALETEDVAGAEEQARRCRRLVPRMQASAYTHTPEVRELVARIDAELAREITGSLTVSSDPPGCGVRINGVYFGQTPLGTSDLPRGEYRVQVECDERFPGRVHRVRIADEDVRLEVRASFDRALRSRPELALIYGEGDEADGLSDATSVARILARPVLAAEPDGDRLTLVAIDANGRHGGARTISLSNPSERDAQELARFLPSPPDSGSMRAARRETLDAGTRARRRIGLALSSAGAGMIAAGSGLHALRVRRGEHLDAMASTTPGYLDAQHDYLALRGAVLATELAGSAVAVIGGSLAVRTIEKRRPLAIVGGAVGLALSGFAAFEVARAPLCYGDAICTQRDLHLDRAVLLGAAAGPALSLPIAAGTGTREHGLRASVRIGSNVATLQLRGALR